MDPFQPNRVWFQLRVLATHTGETPTFGKPTGKKLELPPQSYAVTFTESGKVAELTVGYVIDRQQGNTGGLGGAFAYLYGVGTSFLGSRVSRPGPWFLPASPHPATRADAGKPLPIPECKPYRRSWQFKLLNFVGRLASARQRGGSESD